MANDFIQLVDGTYVRRSVITRFQINAAQDTSWGTGVSESEAGEAVVNVMISDAAQREWVTGYVGKSKQDALDWLQANQLL